MFACPAVKTGGCPFHSTSHTTKGDGREEGFNARVWTQAIISNYCFSFQFSCRDGGLTRRTRNNPLQSARISGPFGAPAQSRDSAAFISMWVRSWFKRGVMGELTPGTQLSMGSAKRLYVLMAGFYMRWAFRTSAVKSRHKIFGLGSAPCNLLLPPGILRVLIRVHSNFGCASDISSGVCRPTRPASLQIAGAHFPSRRTLIRLPLGVYVQCAASDSHDRRWALGESSMRRYAQKYFLSTSTPTRQEVEKQASRRHPNLNHPRDVTSLVVPRRLLEKEKRSQAFTRCVHPFGFCRSCQSQRMLWPNKKPQVLKYEWHRGAWGWEDSRRGKTTYKLTDRWR